MTNDSPFDAAVALRPQADGTFIGNTSAAYGNMVGPFGGVTAAGTGAEDGTRTRPARYLHRQPRDAWTHELDLRPWSEKF